METAYYASLSKAVEAVNAGSAGETVVQESAAVEVFTTDRQVTKVVLLADLTESQLITVSKDIDLILNGHTLTFSDPGAHLQFAAGTNCQLHGAGGKIYKNLESASSDNVLLVDVAGSSLRVTGGSYIADCNAGGNVMVFRAGTSCELFEMNRCAINAGNANMGARCIQSAAAHCLVKDSECEVNAVDEAVGLLCAGKVKLKGTKVNAMSREEHAKAVHVASGTFYIDDCDLNGISENKEAYTMYVQVGTVTVNGSKLHAVSNATKAYGCIIIDGIVTFDHCDIRADVQGESAKGIELWGGTLNVLNSSILATGLEGNNVDAYGIGTYEGTTLTVKDSSIITDCTGDCYNSGNNTHGIMNSGTAHLENVTVYGNHSGIQNNNGAKLYVSGGTYAGYCHGGFYFAHGAEGEAFVNDAVIRGGQYAGIFDYTEVDAKDIKYSVFYIGGGADAHNSNVTTYLDGCTIDASNCNTTMVLRGSSGEQNNTVNISNCAFTDPTKWIRIDNATHRLNLGTGINLDDLFLKNGYIDGTSVDYMAAGVVTATKALYRKLP